MNFVVIHFCYLSVTVFIVIQYSVGLCGIGILPLHILHRKKNKILLFIMVTVLLEYLEITPASSRLLLTVDVIEWCIIATIKAKKCYHKHQLLVKILMPRYNRCSKI